MVATERRRETGGELGASGALGVPDVRRHQLVALRLRLDHRPSGAGIERDSCWPAVEPPLVGQRRQRDPPALAGRADDVVGGHPGIGEEHLVERGMPVHLANRANLDTGLPHIDREVREAAVLGGVPVGPRDEQAVLGVVGARVPQLLPVHDPLVAVAVGPSHQAGEIRPVAGLAEQLAPPIARRWPSGGGSVVSRRRSRARGWSARPNRCRPRPVVPVRRRPPARRATTEASEADSPRPYHSTGQVGHAQPASTSRSRHSGSDSSGSHCSSRNERTSCERSSITLPRRSVITSRGGRGIPARHRRTRRVVTPAGHARRPRSRPTRHLGS